jgi:hypothetical protein
MTRQSPPGPTDLEAPTCGAGEGWPARDEARIVVTEVEHGRLETSDVPAPGLPLHTPDTSP